MRYPLILSFGVAGLILLPRTANANPYVKTYNQFMGYASTGEPIALMTVKTPFRGGVGSFVTYRIGNDVVNTGIQCISYGGDPRPCFTDQGTRYAKSAATKKILSIACSYEKTIMNRHGSMYDTAP